MKDIFFVNYFDVVGVNIIDVFHYVENDNPSTYTTESDEITSGTTLLAKNLAKSSIYAKVK